MARKKTIDEPTFTIKASDHNSSSVVRYWAERFHESCGRDMSQNLEQLNKYNEAYQVAAAMDIWRTGATVIEQESDEG